MGLLSFWWPFSSVLCWVSWGLFSFWVPSLSLWLFPIGFSACCISLPCVLHLLLFWPSLGFLTTFFCFSLLCDSVESQFLRDGVLPPGRVSTVGVFVHSFPWFHFLSSSLGVFSRLLRFLSLLFSVCRLLSASEGFPGSFYTSLSCRLAFPSTLGLFLFLFLRLSLSSSGFPSSFLFPLLFLLFFFHPVAVHLCFI